MKENLVEDPGAVGVGALQQLVEGGRLVQVAVIDEILAGVLAVVRPGLRREVSHKPQHFQVRSQRPLHRHRRQHNEA